MFNLSYYQMHKLLTQMCSKEQLRHVGYFGNEVESQLMLEYHLVDHNIIFYQDLFFILVEFFSNQLSFFTLISYIHTKRLSFPQ